jgi:hypothetical protein
MMGVAVRAGPEEGKGSVYCCYGVMVGCVAQWRDRYRYLSVIVLLLAEARAEFVLAEAERGCGVKCGSMPQDRGAAQDA